MKTWLKFLSGTVFAVAGMRLIRKHILAGHPLHADVLAQDLSGRVVIVTGANDGLGKATTMILAGMGCTVVLACRNAAKARTAIDDILSYDSTIRREQLRYLYLDLADLESIHTFAAGFRAEYNHLDILVNNAGVGVTSALGVTADGIEAVFQINHLGHFYLTHLLHDLIVLHNARVVNVSSFGHRYRRDPACFDDVRSAMKGSGSGVFLYTRTKLANILFTRELQKRLKRAFPDYKGDAFAVNPGRVYTGAWGKMYPRWLKPFFAIVGWLTMKTPLEGAATTVYAALSPALRDRGGTYLTNCAITPPSSLVQDDDLATTLWRRSEALLNITFLPEGG